MTIGPESMGGGNSKDAFFADIEDNFTPEESQANQFMDMIFERVASPNATPLDGEFLERIGVCLDDKELTASQRFALIFDLKKEYEERAIAQSNNSYYQKPDPFQDSIVCKDLTTICI